MQLQWALVGSLSELVLVCMYVCLSVTIEIQYMGLCIVYLPF